MIYCLIPISFHPPTNATPEEDLYANLFGALVISLPFIITFGYVAYKKITASAWDKGQFPSDLKYNKDNLLQAYICLSAWMLRVDRKNSIDKIDYMNRFFRSKFGQRDFREDLNFAYNNQINLRTITSWLALHLNQQERSQVLYFLVGLSLIDGGIDSNEKNILDKVRSVLDISPKELNSIIASYAQQRQRKHKESKASASNYSKKSILKLAYDILGISEHASIDEVKKAYRSLVKKHHPDVFATEPIQQQKIAEERFLEIQKAYEMIEKYK
ncbi:MAG: DnaJ like chaperone protein [Crocinitomicaceae bacterium]|jgi:DnaJ like chaperone protein